MKLVSIGHFNDVAQRKHVPLATMLYLHVICPPDCSLKKYAVHVCWEAIRPVAVDFPHAWAAHARDTATSAGGRHGQRQNARYVLVKSTYFFNFFHLRVLAHGPYRVIAVKTVWKEYGNRPKLQAANS